MTSELAKLNRTDFRQPIGELSDVRGSCVIVTTNGPGAPCLTTPEAMLLGNGSFPQLQVDTTL